MTQFDMHSITQMCDQDVLEREKCLKTPYEAKTHIVVLGGLILMSTTVFFGKIIATSFVVNCMVTES